MNFTTGILDCLTETDFLEGNLACVVNSTTHTYSTFAAQTALNTQSVNCLDDFFEIAADALGEKNTKPNTAGAEE